MTQEQMYDFIQGQLEVITSILAVALIPPGSSENKTGLLELARRVSLLPISEELSESGIKGHRYTMDEFLKTFEDIHNLPVDSVKHLQRFDYLVQPESPKLQSLRN